MNNVNEKHKLIESLDLSEGLFDTIAFKPKTRPAAGQPAHAAMKEFIVHYKYAIFNPDTGTQVPMERKAKVSAMDVEHASKKVMDQHRSCHIIDVTPVNPGVSEGLLDTVKGALGMNKPEIIPNMAWQKAFMPGSMKSTIGAINSYDLQPNLETFQYFMKQMSNYMTPEEVKAFVQMFKSQDINGKKQIIKGIMNKAHTVRASHAGRMYSDDKNRKISLSEAKEPKDIAKFITDEGFDYSSTIAG